MPRSVSNQQHGSFGTGVALAIVAGVSAVGLATYLNRPPAGPPDSAPLRARRGTQREGGATLVGRTVTIDKPRHELYAVWRDPTATRSTFMENVERVAVGEQGHLLWTIRGPMGRPVHMKTEIVEHRDNEHIAWASLPGSDIEAHGRVSFSDAPGGRGTRVEAEIAYKPPGGEIGRWIAKLFAAEPEIQGRRELKRFKMLMETGEIATSANRRASA